MRQRLTQSQRKTEILISARKLFLEKTYADTEMEDVRLACEISRGGLYHHFANKAAILEALVSAEIADLVDEISKNATSPIETLLDQGASQLGNDPGILKALNSAAEKLTYLGLLEKELYTQLGPALSDALKNAVRDGVNPDHIAELFLTVNAQINRRLILGDWTNERANAFTVTALEALLPFLDEAARPSDHIRKFLNRS